MDTQAPPSATSSIAWEAAISAVTVYERGARVTRTGRVEVPEGSSELVLRNLPAGLVADSVRARGQGTAQARLLGVDVRRTFYAQPAGEGVQALTARVRDLEDQARSLALRAEAVEADRRLLSNLAASAGRQLARAMARAGADDTRGPATLSFLREQFASADERLLAVEREQRDVADRLAQARAELEQASTPQEREGHDVTVGLEAARAGNITLEVTYTVSNASWRPLYDLRLIEQDGGAQIATTYFAEVRQRTGESWEGVSLTLSTARQVGGERVPELEPWFLRTMAIPRPMAFGKADMRRAAPEMEPAPMEMLAEPLAPLTADVSTAGPAVTYRVPRPATVPGDGEPHKATVAQLDLTPTLDYVTAPKLAETAFRRAHVTNASEYVFLPGRASVFWGDELVGHAQLDAIAPGQTFELALGADDRVTVARKPISRGAEKALLRDVRRSRWGYEITIENLTGATQTVFVRDQIPVSTHERVAVRLDEANPSPTTQTEMGLLGRV